MTCSNDELNINSKLSTLIELNEVEVKFCASYLQSGKMEKKLSKELS